MDPTDVVYSDKNLFIWWKPERGKKYFICCDVARGDGKDNSVAQVWDVQKMEQQAEYYGKIPSEEFAKLLYDLGHQYNTAPIVVENNSIGLACLEHLRLLQYEAVFYSVKSAEISAGLDPDKKIGIVVNTKWPDTNNNLIQGFTTSQKTRPLLIDKFEQYVRNHSLIIRSKRVHEELRTFIWDGGRAEAMRGKNDDAVMTTALSTWMRDVFFNSCAETTNNTTTEKLLLGISYNTNTNDKIMGASKNPLIVPQKNLGAFVSMAEKQTRDMSLTLPNGQKVNFNWLYDTISKG
jgi:hypothetical protein